MRKKNKISFSRIEKYNTCPHACNLDYNILPKEKRFKKNIYNAFGSSLHKGIETELQLGNFNFKEHFLDSILKFTDEEKKQQQEKYKDLKKKIQEMLQVGPILINDAIDFLNKNYPTAEVVAIEKKLDSFVNENTDYIGFIDLILRFNERYKIIDWKSCSWGWDAEKRSNKYKIYQLIYYKEFLARQENIDPEIIDPSFVLLKRVSKPGKRVEQINPTSGKIRTKNALKVLQDTEKNIFHHKKYWKNIGKHCRMCSYNNTEYCPGDKG